MLKVRSLSREGALICLLLVYTLFAHGQSEPKKPQPAKPDSKCDATIRVCKRDWKHLWWRHCKDTCAYKVEILLAK
jgi:hypothetical protein